MNIYFGTLEYYTEMGEIQIALANINHPHPSPYAKWFVFDKKTQAWIKITNPKTKELVFEGEWRYSRKNTAEILISRPLRI